MSSKIFKISLYLSILLNIFDVILHVATNQPEILRITGNIFIIVASVIALQRQRSNPALIVGLLSYLILNGIFIGLSGIGTAGIAFVTLTTILTLVSLLLHKTK